MTQYNNLSLPQAVQLGAMRLTERQDKSTHDHKFMVRLSPINLTSEGDLSSVVLAMAITLGYLLAGNATSGVSIYAALAFISMALPFALLVLVVCGKFLERISAVAGYVLVFFAVSSVVYLAHSIQLYFLGGPEDSLGLLLRRLLFANLLVVYLMRQSFLQHRLRRREESEQNAKIQALQSRIRPHFLFNSMNAIASLIPVDPAAAEQVVEDLSELFRASLQESGTFVRVSQELELCQRYMNIESLRLGERLKIEWKVETPPAGAQMPLLILQPLIENAIYHGIQPLLDGGTISIDVYFKDGNLRAKIINPSFDQEPARFFRDETAGRHRKPHMGNHLAIGNIRERLAIAYGEKAKLITVQEGNTFRTEVICPTVSKMI